MMIHQHQLLPEWNLVPDSHSTALLVLCCTVCCIWKLKSECCEKLCDCCTAIKKQLCKSAVFRKFFVENRGFYALFFKNHFIFDVFSLSKKIIHSGKKICRNFCFECSFYVQKSKELWQKRLVFKSKILKKMFWYKFDQNDTNMTYFDFVKNSCVNAVIYSCVVLCKSCTALFLTAVLYFRNGGQKPSAVAVL